MRILPVAIINLIVVLVTSVIITLIGGSPIEATVVTAVCGYIYSIFIYVDTKVG